MPRASAHQRSGVDYAPDQTPFQSGIRVPAAAGADSKAQALQQALGIATGVAAGTYTRAENANAEQGALDAARGTVDDKKLKHSQAYERTYVQTQSAARFVEAEGEFRNWYDTEFDKTRGAPEELSQKLDEFFQERYGHVDRLEAEVLVPRMSQMRQKLLSEQQQNIQTAVQNDQLAAVSTLVRDAVANNQVVDADAMKEKLLPIFSKAESAQHYSDIIGTLAVEHGDPDMIDRLIPEKWTDGTPGPRSTPKIANALNQYRAYAEQAANKQEQEARGVSKQKVEQGLIEVSQLAANNNSLAARQKLDELAALGVMSQSDYNSTINFIEGRRDQQREDSYDPQAYIEWRANLAADPEVYGNPSYIYQNAHRLFQRGSNYSTSVAQAMDDVQSARNAYRSAREKPVAAAYRSALDKQYKPDTALATPEEKRLYAEGLFAFDKSLSETQDVEQADAAARLVLSKIDEMKKSPVRNLKSDAAALTSSQLSPDAFRLRYAADPNAVANIRDALRKGDITPEQAKAAARALQ